MKVLDHGFVRLTNIACQQNGEHWYWPKEMVEIVKAEVRATGSYKAFARKHNVFPSAISSVLNGRYSPTTLARCLGYEIVILYRKVT